LGNHKGEELGCEYLGAKSMNKHRQPDQFYIDKYDRFTTGLLKEQEAKS
jgi:hypothetical protein